MPWYVGKTNAAAIDQRRAAPRREIAIAAGPEERIGRKIKWYRGKKSQTAGKKKGNGSKVGRRNARAVVLEGARGNKWRMVDERIPGAQENESRRGCRLFARGRGSASRQKEWMPRGRFIVPVQSFLRGKELFLSAR